MDVNDGDCVSASGQGDPYSVVYCSIQDAIDDASAGDTINVATGTYAEGITVNKGVSVVGAGMDQTLIQGNSFISGDGALIDGCHIQATTAGTHGVQIYPGSGAEDVTIRNTRIETQFSGKAAIYVETFGLLDGFTLTGNEIIGDYGLTQSFGALNTVIRDNTFEGISGSTS